MISEPFPTGMPRGAPSEGVPGHECTVRSKCDSIRPREIRMYTLRPRQGLQDHHSGSPTRTRRRPKVAKSGIFTGLEAGLDGVPQVGVLDFEPDRYVGRPRIRADAGLRGTCAGWAKVRLKTRHYREQQTKECVSHVPRVRDRPPVHAQHATTAARVVRCPFVRNTLHGVIFLMQCLD